MYGLYNLFIIFLFTLCFWLKKNTLNFTNSSLVAWIHVRIKFSQFLLIFIFNIRISDLALRALRIFVQLIYFKVEARYLTRLVRSDLLQTCLTTRDLSGLVIWEMLGWKTILDEPWEGENEVAVFTSTNFVKKYYMYFCASFKKVYSKWISNCTC